MPAKDTKFLTTCEHCGKEFQYWKCRPRVFCSRACSNAARRATFSIRFWARVVPHPSDCWLWTGAIGHWGYGVVGVSSTKVERAHRVAYELTHGPIPAGLHVLHRCDVRNCCNPSHLFLGTYTDNMQDMLAKKRDRASRYPESFPVGAATVNARLTEDQVREIRRRFDSGESDRRTLAADFRINRSTVDQIVSRKTWKHVV